MNPIHPRETRTCVHVKPCMLMFIEALFVLETSGGNPRIHWLLNRWMWCVCAMERYLLIKENEVQYILQHEWTLKTSCKVKVSHKRAPSVWFLLHETARISKSTDTDGEFVIEGGWGKGKWGVAAMGVGFLFGVIKNVLKSIVVTVYNPVNTLKATEYTLQMGEWYGMWIIPQ